MAAEFYTGKICAKHPELGGMRYVIGKRCQECTRERGRVWAKVAPEKAVERAKAWRLNNPEKAKAWYEAQGPEYWRRKNRESNYGLIEEQYQALIKQHNNCCAVCGRPQSDFRRALCIDHCHTTGKIRGLLCDNCNHLLGKAKENIETLKAAIKYLKRHSK